MLLWFSFFFPSRPLCIAFSLVCFAAAAFIHATSVDIMRHGHTQATNHPPTNLPSSSWSTHHTPHCQLLHLAKVSTRHCHESAIQIYRPLTTPPSLDWHKLLLDRKGSYSNYSDFVARQLGKHSKPCLFIRKNNNKLGSELKKTSTQAYTENL